MKSTNCHSEPSDSVKFCPECGAKVNERIVKTAKNCWQTPVKVCTIRGTKGEIGKTIFL